MTTRAFYVYSLFILQAVNSLTEAQDCSFPTNLHGEWRIDNSNIYKVNDEKFEKVDQGGQVIVTYSCSSLRLSAGSSRVFDYLLLAEQQNSNNKLCVQFKVDGTNILYFAQANLGDSETEPTAENSCTGKDYEIPYHIYIKTSEAENCFYLNDANGKFQARVKTDDSLATVCAYDNASLVNILDSSLHMNTCVADVSGLPLKGSVLSCTGVIRNQRYIGASQLSSKAMIVRYQNRYYCSRILTPIIVGVRIREIWLSIDITEYSQGMIQCQALHSEQSSRTDQYVSIKLTPFDCELGACQNGGVCTQQLGSYTCVCKDGFSGDNCETDVCTPSPCQNGGTCVRTAEGYSCTCVDGVVGLRCDQIISAACLSSPCQNGGTCSVTEDGFSCACADGFTGDLCDIIAATGATDRLGQEESNSNNRFPWYWIVVIILSVVAVLFLIVILGCLATCNTYEETLKRYEQEVVTDSEVNEETGKTIAEPNMAEPNMENVSAKTEASKKTGPLNITPVSANLQNADYGSSSGASSDDNSLATDFTGSTMTSDVTRKSANRLSTNRPSVNKRKSSKRHSRTSARRASTADDDPDDAVSQGNENGTYYALLSEARLLSEIL